jgi:hypothetical protein
MRMIGIYLTLSLSLLAARAVAGETCGVPACDPAGCGSADKCARCGCETGCQQRTCQLICGTEKVKKYCWEVKCEEFCPLLPGRICDDCNDCNGNGNGPCQNCNNNSKCGEKCPNPTIRTPRTANARVKKTLVKKEYECERPKYKTVVQYLCPGCASGCESTAPTPANGPKPEATPPAPQPKSTFATPLPPVMRTSFTK